MHIYSAYCAIRDRNVCVEMAGEPTHERQANHQDHLRIICTKYSYATICTGEFCPNFGQGRVGLGVAPARICPTA